MTGRGSLKLLDTSMRHFSSFLVLALCLASDRLPRDEPIYPVAGTEFFTWNAPGQSVHYEYLDAVRPGFPLQCMPYDRDLKAALVQHDDTRTGFLHHKNLVEERREKEQRRSLRKTLDLIEERIRQRGQKLQEAKPVELIPEIVIESPTETVIETTIETGTTVEKDDFVTVDNPSLATIALAPTPVNVVVYDHDRIQHLIEEMGRTGKNDKQRTNHTAISQVINSALRPKLPEPARKEQIPAIEPARHVLNQGKEQSQPQKRKLSELESAINQQSAKKSKASEPVVTSISSDDAGDLTVFIVEEPKMQNEVPRFAGKDRSMITFTTEDNNRIVLFNVFKDTNSTAILKLLESKGLQVDKVLPSTGILKSWNRQHVVEVIMKSEDDAKRAVGLIRGAALDKRALGVAVAPATFTLGGLTACFGLVEDDENDRELTYVKLISLLNPLHARFNKAKGVVKMLFNSKKEVMEARSQVMRLRNSAIQLLSII